ncbi:hypothetical protein [Limosilactobacillus reuteri]|nr:hypothetical protein [Limosilactobacillus reuteri]MCD7123362.1 hypothetical protein [Limosilactobacillus caviae]MCH5378986.1 hypothetical protein [Limosilactobacillus reuteri]
MVDGVLSAFMHFSIALYILSIALLNLQKFYKKLHKKKPKRKNKKR